MAIRQPGCGKIGHASRGDAIRVMRRSQTNGATGRRVYRCPRCRLYHITSQRTRHTRPKEWDADE